MIENYKGWDITLNWDNKDYLERDTIKSNFFNQKEKWIGVHLNGEKIYGSSLKEIRHIIDYPSLHAKYVKRFFNYPDYFHYLQLVH